MSRVFVCSPLRGADGQPSAANVKLARRLMRAVFDAGHAPFVPHLLYPQVLSESEADLHVSFAANYAFLAACEEIWVYAGDITACSRGMHAEVSWVQRENQRRVEYPSLGLDQILVRYMPPPFVKVRAVHTQELALVTERVGSCSRCQQFNGLNHYGVCLKCFADGTPASV